MICHARKQVKQNGGRRTRPVRGQLADSSRTLSGHRNGHSGRKKQALAQPWPMAYILQSAPIGNRYFDVT
jgi:hypothetical protein